RVLFAVGQTADDLIEELLRADPTPARTAVVSSDRRLKQAARRRGARALGCMAYLEELARPRPPAAPPAPDPAAQPDGESPEEARRLLDAFGEVDDDPKLHRGF